MRPGENRQQREAARSDAADRGKPNLAVRRKAGTPARFEDARIERALDRDRKSTVELLHLVGRSPESASLHDSGSDYHGGVVRRVLTLSDGQGPGHRMATLPRRWPTWMAHRCYVRYF